MIHSFPQTPSIISEYPLDPFGGANFTLIEPYPATNLIKNPDFAIGLNYWTVINVGTDTLVRSDDNQWIGAYSAKCTPRATPPVGGMYYSGGLALANGTTYWSQLRFLGVPGARYLFYFATSAGAQLGASKLVYATGWWQWIYWSYPETSTASRRIYIARFSTSDPNGPFYVDAVQVEADRLTTYLNGSMKGFGREPAYLWAGLPHGSESQRSALTSTGGILHSMDKYRFTLEALNGLGLAPVDHMASPVAGRGGSVYQRTDLAAERPFDVIGTITGDTLRHLMENRSKLMRRLSPFRSPNQQPLPLLFELPDAASIPVKVPSHYVDGLGGALDNQRSERLALRFLSYNVDVRSQMDQGNVLPYRKKITGADYLLMRSKAGVWSAFTGSTNGRIVDFFEAHDGAIYAVGDFTTIGGVAANYIAKYDRVTQTWSALGSGLNSGGRGIVEDAQGNLYVVGIFTTPGSHVAMWNPLTSTWSALGSGLNGNATGVGISPTGLIYVTGTFTTAGGGGAVNAAVWNPATATWAALGSGLNAAGANLTVGPDGRIYFCGAFTTAGGVTVNRVAVWNPNTSAWAALGAGMNNDVYYLKFGPDGFLYALGPFTTAGGNTASKIAYWNQTAWYPLGGGLNGDGWRIAIDPSGRLYVTGLFSSVGTGIAADSFAQWTLGAWTALEVDIPGSPVITTVYLMRSGELWIGYDTTGTTYTSDQVTLSNIGTLDSYPILRFKGPGRLYSVKNWTTGDVIYFNLTLLASEEAVLDLTPGQISFTSSLRGDILSTILPGSNHGTFRFVNGTNLISTFILSSPFEQNDNNNWFSAWDFQGATGLNTDDGRIYIHIVITGPDYYIFGFIDQAFTTQVVGTGPLTTTGVKTLIEVNLSGMTGNVTVDTVPSSEDSDILIDVPIAETYWTPRFASIDDSVRTV